ncbi:Protein REVERSION-TO-ETHYLENE SENSITIVITY1 [Capsicum chinense]|nr:Protein REVERSION-TO-ETHYLENE SENSITIVITY1 [Capsicum chinense]
MRNTSVLPRRSPKIDVNPRYVVERDNAAQVIQHDLWPLAKIDPTKQKFPCCLVWTPLPVVSWLAPFVGHVAICREDGAIVDFSGDSMIRVGHLLYGDVARYYQMDRQQCCFGGYFGGHTCKQSYQHAQFGRAISWDDAVQLSARNFVHRTFNIFSCNGHSFAANCLNRLSYGGSMHWNMINVGALIMFKGQWVDGWSILRSFVPLIVVVCYGYLVIGWACPVVLLSFYLLLFGWYVLVSYCFKNLESG